MADIFEVRGYPPRPKRGTLCPIEVDGDRSTFSYDGLDGIAATHDRDARPAPRSSPVEDGEKLGPGAAVVATLDDAAQARCDD